MDLTKYFKHTAEKSVIFTGDTLEILIPKRYESYGCLEIQSTISTVGIFDMILNEKDHVGYFLPAHIVIEPSAIENIVLKDDAYVKATLHNGDVFIKSSIIIKTQQLAYVIFKEFVMLGNMPKFISYNDCAFLFDSVQKVCDLRFEANRVVFEIIWAHLAKDPHNIMVPYRLTKMDEPPNLIPLREVAHAAESTTSKLIGSYLGDSINSALVNPTDKPSELEDILRL